jgi:hypothetical protein
MMRRLHKLAWAAIVLNSGIASDRARGDAPPRAGWSDLVPKVAGARHYHVAPDGRSSNPGSSDAPWDLASALGGRREVAPGDVIWVRGGTYKGTFELKLAGKDRAPVHVRAVPGQRATIRDGTLLVVPPASYVWVWDLEITSSITARQRVIPERGSHPESLPKSFGEGVNISAGKGCKFINLVVHDNRQGIGFREGSIDSEIHGCLIVDNGWKAPDRGYGHCISAQNKEGVKTISQCIMTARYEGADTLHASGSSQAYVDNFLVEENIAFDQGPFLIGGGRPSRGIRVLRNVLYGVNLRIGSGADNVDCEVRDNRVVKGDLAIEKFQSVIEEGNLQDLPDRQAVVFANKYDPNRAHLAVFNGLKQAAIHVDVSAFLKPGDPYRLINPNDYFGRPVLTGTCSDSSISIPMYGEFAPFVLIKGRGDSGP